jgi:AAA domain
MPSQNCPHSDLVLRALCDLPEPLGSLVMAFPGRAAATEDTHWIDAWFTEQAAGFAAGKASEPIKFTTHEPEAGELSPLKRPPVSSRVRLISVLPHYFRGFRAPKALVTLESDLVLIEGPNSSGKTSLSEAFEWAFTGGLSRRSSGHPRELANCIANEFRPRGEQTWVECVLAVDDKPVTIRRVLSQDYTEKAAGISLSDVYRDGERLSSAASNTLLEDLFAGVAPILMQHTLRQFVHDTPESRRQYFERLLQIDELTALIEKAVVGDARLLEFVPPTGAVSYTRWEDLRSAVGSAAKGTLDDVKDSAESLTKPELQGALAAVAVMEFPTAIGPGSSFANAHTKLQAAHAGDREKRFPVLGLLRPAKEPTVLKPARELLAGATTSFRATRDALAAALAAAHKISQADLALSLAVEALVEAGLIDANRDAAVMCPLCEYSSVPTLTQSRIAGVRSRRPLAAAIDTAKAAYAGATHEVNQEIEALLALLARITPKPPSSQVLQTQLKGLDPQLVAEATLVQAAAAALAGELARLKALLTTAATSIADPGRESDESIHKALTDILSAMPAIEMLDAEYGARFGELERFVGVLALEEKSYAQRDRWLSVASDLDGVVYAVKWQAAKGKAQDLLATIRKGLIDLRSEIIEDARRTFSGRMTEVWTVLRRDTASRFSQLTIPTARGRGYKLEMEVKAVLSDGKADAEVDALRVFSESQINVLGLAAYITRARLLGHRTLIFDDPVQSMDEDHYRSFAGPLLDSLLNEGFQIVVLTHSDQFVRDIADHHYGRLSFATLRSRGSRRQGCQVDEGSRRVAERLKLAETLADDGKLSDAWKILRLALERLYLLVYAASHPDFDPRSWRTQSAEFMWDNGAGALVEKVVPDSGKRLRDILSLTAAGAHDKPPRGLTDIMESVTFVKSLLTPLRVGDG